jgi:hypothetical protein
VRDMGRPAPGLMRPGAAAHSNCHTGQDEADHPSGQAPSPAAPAGLREKRLDLRGIRQRVAGRGDQAAHLGC